MKGGQFVSKPIDFSLKDLMLSRRDEMIVSVRQRGGTVSINVYDELTPDELDLDTEFSALPGQIAYWSTVVGKYDQMYGRMQRDYEAWYAPLYERWFTYLENETGRKPNISSVEYMLINRSREDYNKWQEELGQVKADLESIRGMVPALNAKLQCLMQLAKRRAAELELTEPGYRSPKINSDKISLDEAKSIFSKVVKKGDTA